MMKTILFSKEKVISFFIWAFFSFAMLQLFSVFVYLINSGIAFFLIAALLYSCSLLGYAAVFRIRFHVSLNFLHYTISNVLMVILMTGFSFGYYLMVKLSNDVYQLGYYAALAIFNTLLGSLFFLFTLIKK